MKIKLNQVKIKLNWSNRNQIKLIKSKHVTKKK